MLFVPGVVLDKCLGLAVHIIVLAVVHHHFDVVVDGVDKGFGLDAKGEAALRMEGDNGNGRRRIFFFAHGEVFTNGGRHRLLQQVLVCS